MRLYKSNGKETLVYCEGKWIQDMNQSTMNIKDTYYDEHNGVVYFWTDEEPLEKIWLRMNLVVKEKNSITI